MSQFFLFLGNKEFVLCKSPEQFSDLEQSKEKSPLLQHVLPTC